MRIALPLIVLCTMLALGGCKSTHTLSHSFDLRSDAERIPKPRFTGTRHIDSVDVNNLSVDVWKVEHYAYPDSIRLFVRILDSTGYVVTHMADPYRKPGAPDYFRSLQETIGERRGKKTIDVSPFRVREFGEQDSVPTYISLAIDYSGSMKGAREAIEMGTDLFIGMKRPCDNIALTTYHKTISTVFPLSADTATMMPLWRAHKAVAPGLFTASYDGIRSALDQLRSVPIERTKVLVVFADGDENTSRATLSDIFETAVKNNVSIYCVGFGYAHDEALENLSVYTGGKYYRAYTKADLLAIFMDIYMSLRNYYLVTYVPPTYDGLHVADLVIDIPGRDTMVARARYDKSPIGGPGIDPPLGREFSRPIIFAYNRSDIDSTSMYIIDEIADAMLRKERIILEVQGHTDNIGGEEFNLKLSMARAESVKNALVARGVSEERLRVRGLGLSMPVATNDTEAGRAQNRRTVFRVLRK